MKNYFLLNYYSAGSTMTKTAPLITLIVASLSINSLSIPSGKQFVILCAFKLYLKFSKVTIDFGVKEKIEILNKSISTTEQKEIAITSFVDKIKKYTEMNELTPEIINELIDKILVHQQIRVDGKKYQQIDIYYSGVGIISVSANEYDFEKEFQNMLKNQIKTA